MGNTNITCKEYVIWYTDGTNETRFSTNFNGMLKRLQERETVKQIDKVFKKTTYRELVYESGEK